VEQVSEDDPLRRGYFQVTTDGENRSFPPLIATEGGEDVLIEDVGYFFRGPSPYNQHRTVTLCNGMFNRGVQGAVRALTDRTFRDGNAEYLFETFGDADSYSLLFRVAVMEQAALTPDWTAAGTVLHAWSERSG
jgi:hypothetical protein